jgi:hypothetical protein
VIFSSDLIQGQALADHLGRGQSEAVVIGHVVAEVVAIGLLVKIAEQVEWFD